MKIKVATQSDFPTIQSIAHRTWPDTFGSILSPVQIDYMLDMMYTPTALAEQVQKGHRFFLLEDEGTPFGYISIQHDYLPGTTKIHKLYVLPGIQGRGYGKALIMFAKEKAVAAGQARLRLDVNYQNKAIGFYEHLGFIKVGRFDTDIGNGFLMEDFIFEIEL